MNLTQKQRVQIVRAAGCKGYDKSLDSKASNPDKYGVTWTQHARTAIEAVATARNGAESDAKANSPTRAKDRHRHKGRVSARMPKEQAARIQSDVKFCGYGTVQNWIGACAHQLHKEADKRRARLGRMENPAGQTEKSPSGTGIPKGAKKNTPCTVYHGKGDFVNV